MSDNVKHPEHYGANENGIECIEVTECMNFNLGNAVKYIWRAGKKGDAIEDLRKAIQYLEFEIARYERREDKPSKPGYIYHAPLCCLKCNGKCTGLCECHGWISLGCTSEGYEFVPVDGPIHHVPMEHTSTVSFKAGEVSKEALARVFGKTDEKPDVIYKDNERGPVERDPACPVPQPLSENGCCGRAFYSGGSVHSTTCNVSKVQEVAKKLDGS